MIFLRVLEQVQGQALAGRPIPGNRSNCRSNLAMAGDSAQRTAQLPESSGLLLARQKARLWHLPRTESSADAPSPSPWPFRAVVVPHPPVSAVLAPCYRPSEAGCSCSAAEHLQSPMPLRLLYPRLESVPQRRSPRCLPHRSTATRIPQALYLPME